MSHQTWQRRAILAVINVFAFALISGTLVLSFQWLHKPFPGFFLHENLTVGPYFLPRWSGAFAGLKSLDRVVAVDGRSLRQRSDLYDLVKNSPTGTSFRYAVVRGAQTLTLTIPSMNFAFHDWFLTFGVYVVMGLAFLIIGVAPFYFRASSPAALPLCFMVMAVFVWFESTFDFMTTSMLPKELRIFGLTFTPAGGLHLVLLLKTGRPLRRDHPVYLIVIYGISLALGLLYSATFFGPPDYWAFIFRAEYAYACLTALVFLGIVGLALRGSVPDLERSRLRVMFFGALLGFFLPTLATVLASSFRLPIPYNLALVPTIFFPLSVAYALLKYSLFDLGNALKVGLSRIALTAFLLAIYAVVVFLLGPWMGVYGEDPLIPLFFSVLVVLLFNPLLRWIEAVVDRYVYRQDYNAVEVQEEVSHFLRSLATAPALAEGFLSRMTDRVGIASAALAYRPKSASEYLTSAVKEKTKAINDVAEAVRSVWDQQSGAGYQAVSRGEIRIDPRYRDRRDALLKLFEQLKSELVIPIVLEREVRGFVAFGVKRSRKEYSAEDLRLLGTLTDQLALSLENGRLYETSVEAYNKVESTNRRLLEVDRVKKQFVANICHELRTPVSTIIGFGEVLLDANVGAGHRGILERLVSNGQELSKLMDNLLNYSRMEADTVSMNFEIVKLKEILQALQLMTQRLIRERPIEFNLHMESAIETIESDGQKLQQILAELLTNAVKFTEKGKIEVSVRTIAAQEKSSVEIAVADTGIGIDAPHREIIFDDFRQLDGSTTRKYGGTGLGLTLCRKLARALGGQIRVTSEIGIGSVFSLLLPLVPQETKASGIA